MSLWQSKEARQWRRRVLPGPPALLSVPVRHHPATAGRTGARVQPKPLVLTVAVWVGELEPAGQEGLGSVAGESQRYEGPLLNSFQLLCEA